VLATSAGAAASPKTPRAKAAFAAGVKAYQAHSWALASKQLEKSFSLERDVETLFAWAQSERQLEHCDKASELYDKILTFDLPPANKAAVKEKLEECRVILDAANPKPDPTPVVVEEPKRDPVRVEPPPLPPHEPRARWKDPIGLSLVGAGAVGAVIGTVYLIAGASASSTSASFQSTDRKQFESYAATANSDGRIGVAAATIGGGLIALGLIWYATHGRNDETTRVTGWLSSESSGLALGGRF
jgi:hypothetical protein